jgi:tight adherence protein B
MTNLLLNVIIFCFFLCLTLYSLFSIYYKLNFKKRVTSLTVDLLKVVKKKKKRESKSIYALKGNFLYRGILQDIELTLEITTIPLKPNEILRVFLWGTISLSLLSTLFVGYIGALVTFVTAHIILIFLLKSFKSKRKKRMEELIPDVLELMSNSLKTGYSFIQTIDIIRKEKIQPLSFEFDKLYQALILGESFERALQQFADRVDIPEIQTVTDALLITKETGGNISYVIDSLLNIIRENQQLMNEAKTLTAQGKITGWIVGSMPVGITILLYLLSPTYMMKMFTHPLGIALYVVSAFLQIIGIFVIKKLIKIEVR